MEDLIYYKDLYDPMKLGDTKPTSKSDNVQKKKYKKTIEIIRQWVDISVFHFITREMNVQQYKNYKKIIIINLKSLYEIKTSQNKIFTIKRLMNLRCRDRQPMIEYLSDFSGCDKSVQCFVWKATQSFCYLIF